MIKIRRRKPIFEDDQTTQQQQTTGTTAQPAVTPVPANNTTTPAAPAQPQQPAQQPAQPNNTNTPQQPANQNNQQQQQQPNPNAQKVADVLKKMENTWWMISVNLPDEIQKDIPDFKQGNQQADNAIKAWGTFKQNPTEDTFKQFLEGFKAFGGVNNDQTNNQQNGQQPAASAQPQQSAQPQTNVNAGLKAAYSFRKNLMENLEIANKKKYYNSVCEDYFNKTEFTL
ncbi:MAG: hypothetical protein [Vetruanivirus porcinprimi]|uniref:Uncharacterized protein n=1 Tax=phage Lak_Megaphage_RVC_AP1_GC26 TaxID=3109224 RepID=A0ABZ0Z677_9CAUD|nr:MAG: hypothetical protein [phage Lak_Megaphage_RVC_AP1_GC26]